MDHMVPSSLSLYPPEHSLAIPATSLSFRSIYTLLPPTDNSGLRDCIRLPKKQSLVAISKQPCCSYKNRGGKNESISTNPLQKPYYEEKFYSNSLHIMYPLKSLCKQYTNRSLSEILLEGIFPFLPPLPCGPLLWLNSKQGPQGTPIGVRT